MIDRVNMKDGVIAGLVSYAPPIYPCPLCGKESSDRGKRGDIFGTKRICSDVNCRHEFELDPTPKLTLVK